MYAHVAGLSKQCSKYFPRPQAVVLAYQGAREATNYCMPLIVLAYTRLYYILLYLTKVNTTLFQRWEKVQSCNKRSCQMFVAPVQSMPMFTLFLF